MTHFFSKCLWAFFSLMMTIIILLGLAYTYLEFQLPNVKILKDYHPQVPLSIYTSDGLLIAQYGTMQRTPVSLDQIPQNLINALLATEDARYYKHPGVDFVGIIRAAAAVIASGKKVQGASTITMQVARNFFLSRKKTYGRKLEEILLALKIDKEFSKDKILEIYLNKVYFGKQAYGVAAAAQVYYGKTLSELTLSEMAMIAGLPQAPSRNNPITNPDDALKRRNHVLERMRDVGFITSAQYDEAIKAPETAALHAPAIQVSAPYFAEMVRQVVVNDFGDKVYDSGLSVYTTLSSSLQNDAVTSLQQGLIAYANRHGYHQPTLHLGHPDHTAFKNWQNRLAQLGNPANLIPAAVLAINHQSIYALVADGSKITVPWSGLSWTHAHSANQLARPGDVVWLTTDDIGNWLLTQLPSVQGALVSMDPKNGAILALSGGFDYQLSNFNRVTQAQRQPGSGFKPFIYSAALEKGYTLASIINDAPIVLELPGQPIWRPHNDENKFFGPTRLRMALARSLNLASIRLLQAIGVDYALDYIKRFGFDPHTLPHTLSLALGSGVVTPMQMATGYAVFANGGHHITPFFINRITDQSGKVLYQQQPSTDPQVLTPQNAYLMNNVLQSVIQSGTGRAAAVLKRPDLGGKTGTSNNFSDAWFTGFNGAVLAAVWVGFDNSALSLHEHGAEAALPIWIDYMGRALKNTPLSNLPQPPGIVNVRIDATTGLLAPPGDRNSLFELFRADNAPTQYASANPTTATASSISANGNGTSDSAPLF